LCPRLSPGQALARLVVRLQPLYPKGERGRPPIGLERMLRIYFVQQWYGLADEALEDALYDSQALRRAISGTSG
jgi:IS5 family transposase